MPLKIIPTAQIEQYLLLIDPQLADQLNGLEDAELSCDTFSFYTSVASVFSSKIEGANIELDSYIKHKKFGSEYLPDYTKKIDDLYDAYSFAKTNALHQKNFSEAHRLLSRNLVAKHHQGTLRQRLMNVTTADDKIEYVAATPYQVESEMGKFYADLAILLERELSVPEAFFFAAMIHLVFVKIHPWNDGNGRCARLLEKWFLAQKLGDQSCFISSERNCYEQHQTYYKNIRMLGM